MLMNESPPWQTALWRSVMNSVLMNTIATCLVHIKEVELALWLWKHTNTHNTEEPIAIQLFDWCTSLSRPLHYKRLCVTTSCIFLFCSYLFSIFYFYFLQRAGEIPQIFNMKLNGNYSHNRWHFLKMFYVIDRNIFQFWESALVLGF